MLSMRTSVDEGPVLPEAQVRVTQQDPDPTQAGAQVVDRSAGAQLKPLALLSQVTAGFAEQVGPGGPPPLGGQQSSMATELCAKGRQLMSEGGVAPAVHEYPEAPDPICVWQVIVAWGSGLQMAGASQQKVLVLASGRGTALAQDPESKMSGSALPVQA
jgi:hypothetical protein